MSGAYQVEHPPGHHRVTIVALPPPQKIGTVNFGRVFVSLATEYEEAKVDLRIGRPGSYRTENDLVVQQGRKVVREARPNDELVIIRRKEGNFPIAVLVEYESLAQ